MNLYVWTIIDKNFYSGVAVTVLDTSIESARTVARQSLLQEVFHLDTDDEIAAYVQRYPAFADDVQMVEEWVVQEPDVYPVDKTMCSVMIYRE